MPLPVSQYDRRRCDFTASREASLRRRVSSYAQLERRAFMQLVAFWVVLILAVYLRAVL